MTKWKKQDLLILHNNLAKHKGVAPLYDGTVNEICDAIERVNSMPNRRQGQVDVPPKPTLRERWTWFIIKINEPIRF